MSTKADIPDQFRHELATAYNIDITSGHFSPGRWARSKTAARFDVR